LNVTWKKARICGLISNRPAVTGKENNMENKMKNTTKNGKLLAALGGAVLIGTIAFGACASSQTATNTTPATIANKPTNAAAVPEKPPVVNTNNGKMPAAVVDAGEFAENIYDYAKAKDWAKADAKLASLEKSVNELKTANLATPQIIAATDSVGKAVKAKNEIDAMREANQATFLVADLTANYNPKVPVEVVKLDYYGREIEILAMTKDEAKLKLTAQAIRQTWNAVKPKMEAKGAGKESAKFESLVAQTEKAASVSDYSKVATPILDEVDNLEKVFEK
jgi:hypothetical protein